MTKEERFARAVLEAIYRHERRIVAAGRDNVDEMIRASRMLCADECSSAASHLVEATIDGLARANERRHDERGGN